MERKWNFYQDAKRALQGKELLVIEDLEVIQRRKRISTFVQKRWVMLVALFSISKNKSLQHQSHRCEIHSGY